MSIVLASACVTLELKSRALGFAEKLSLPETGSDKSSDETKMGSPLAEVTEMVAGASIWGVRYAYKPPSGNVSVVTGRPSIETVADAASRLAREIVTSR